MAFIIHWIMRNFNDWMRHNSWQFVFCGDFIVWMELRSFSERTRYFGAIWLYWVVQKRKPLPNYQ